MIIEWFGHSSFLIISNSGTKIITDPYEPGAFDGAINYAPINISPDIVTVSHDHSDHGYIEGFQNDFSVVAQPGSRNIKGIEFKGVQSYHDQQLGSLRGKNTMFLMSVDHFRICHLGDLGHELSSSEVEQIGDVDILLIPVGGYYTIGPKEADRVIERLNPRLVIPMHYATDKTNMPIAPVENFLEGKENVKRFNSSGLEIDTREQLPDQREIVVLKHAL